MTVIVFIVPEPPPVVVLNEFHPRTIAWQYRIPGKQLTQDAVLQATLVIRPSFFGAARLVASAFADVSLLQTRVVRTSSFGSPTLAEALPDEVLRATTVARTSSFGAPTLAEQVLVLLRATAVSGTRSFGSPVLSEIIPAGDDFEAIASGAIAEAPL
jgi:hypothetical protein